MQKISFVIPIYNGQDLIRSTTLKLLNECPTTQTPRVILVENGSKDLSRQMIAELSQEFPQQVIGYISPDKGFGYALHLGFAKLLEVNEENEDDHWIVMTAADLPFGFSDIEQAQARLKEMPGLDICVGSKAHAQSQLRRTVSRMILTYVYKWLRRLLLGMKTADPQGTLIMRKSVVRKLAPLIQSRDFFYTTEFIYFAERFGFRIEEVPIVLKDSRHASTVRIFSDSYKMLKQLLHLAVASNKKNFLSNDYSFEKARNL